MPRGRGGGFGLLGALRSGRQQPGAAAPHQHGAARRGHLAALQRRQVPRAAAQQRQRLRGGGRHAGEGPAGAASPRARRGSALLRPRPPFPPPRSPQAAAAAPGPSRPPQARATFLPLSRLPPSSSQVLLRPRLLPAPGRCLPSPGSLRSRCCCVVSFCPSTPARSVTKEGSLSSISPSVPVPLSPTEVGPGALGGLERPMVHPTLLPSPGVASL